MHFSSHWVSLLRHAGRAVQRRPLGFIHDSFSCFRRVLNAQLGGQIKDQIKILLNCADVHALSMSLLAGRPAAQPLDSKVSDSRWKILRSACWLFSPFCRHDIIKCSIGQPFSISVLFFSKAMMSPAVVGASGGLVSNSVREARPWLSYSPRLKGGSGEVGVGRVTELSGCRNGFRKETTPRLKTLRSPRNSCD